MKLFYSIIIFLLISATSHGQVNYAWGDGIAGEPFGTYCLYSYALQYSPITIDATDEIYVFGPRAGANVWVDVQAGSVTINNAGLLAPFGVQTPNLTMTSVNNYRTAHGSVNNVDNNIVYERYRNPVDTIAYLTDIPAVISGSATLTAGAVTVSTASVRTGDIITVVGVSTVTPCATCGPLSYGNIVNGTSFEIHSSLATDTRTVKWLIIHVP